MVERAREQDPEGDYRLIPDGDLSSLETGTYDLVLSAFTFDNVATMDKKVGLMRNHDRTVGDLRAGQAVNDARDWKAT